MPESDVLDVGGMAISVQAMRQAMRQVGEMGGDRRSWISVSATMDCTLGGRRLNDAGKEPVMGVLREVLMLPVVGVLMEDATEELYEAMDAEE